MDLEGSGNQGMIRVAASFQAASPLGGDRSTVSTCEGEVGDRVLILLSSREVCELPGCVHEC